MLQFTPQFTDSGEGWAIAAGTLDDLPDVWLIQAAGDTPSAPLLKIFIEVNAQITANNRLVAVILHVPELGERFQPQMHRIHLSPLFNPLVQRWVSVAVPARLSWMRERLIAMPGTAELFKAETLEAGVALAKAALSAAAGNNNG